MKDQPNILVIQADQLAAKYLGAYGFPIASTPHIDSLAATGAVWASCGSRPKRRASSPPERFVWNTASPIRILGLPIE